MESPARRLYALYEDAIEWAIIVVARRWRMRADAVQDFGQDVRVYFLERADRFCVREDTRNPRALFLRIVARRAIDWRRRVAGRRIPARARNSTPAPAVERLMRHAGADFATAAAVRPAMHDAAGPMVGSYDLLLERRRDRTFLSWHDEKCERVADPAVSANPMAMAMLRDALGCADRVADNLKRALALLSTQERQVLTSHFTGLPAAGSQAGGRRYYRDLRRVLVELRHMLASAGVDFRQAQQAVESGGLEQYCLIHGSVESDSAASDAAERERD